MKKLRVVIVDDNTVFLDSISRFLGRRENIEIVDLAQSGPEALQIVRDQRPDLVLVDLVMPRMNGLALTEQIRGLDHVPRIVILTLADHPAYKEHAQAAGADGLLSKYELTEKLIPMILSLFPTTGDAVAGVLSH